MKMIEKVVIKLDEEERENLINTIDLIERLAQETAFKCGRRCPFKTICDNRSNKNCFFDTVVQDLKYINNNCD